MASASPGFAARNVDAKFRAGLALARWCTLIVALVAAPLSQTADAHGIAGNRYFPGTLTFDDPAVADEAIVPNFSSSTHPGDGGDIIDSRYSWSFFRLLTKTLGVGIDSGWVHRNWGV